MDQLDFKLITEVGARKVHLNEDEDTKEIKRKFKIIFIENHTIEGIEV